MPDEHFLSVPRAVRARVNAAGQAAWLEALPRLIGALEREWGIRAGRPFGGGSEALVAEATLHDGTRAVLKLLMPHDQSAAASEIAFLRLVDGDGCARLLREDAGRGAMLLERLGPPLESLQLPDVRRDVILGGLASRVWRAAQDYGFPTGAEKANWLMGYITQTWEELGRPCPEQVISHAVACAESRAAAHDDERAVLVHGDIHTENALAFGNTFKLVDPDGLLAEAEYDLGVIMRQQSADSLAANGFARAAALARQAGKDARATWEWAVAERVSTGLLCTKLGLQPFATEMLTAAEVAARVDRAKA